MSRWTWFVVLFSRVTLNLAVRVTYPFLPAIARGLGISFERAGLLVAARHLVGLTGAFWGLLGERKGYAWGMVIGLSALFLGSLTVSVSRTFSLALVGFVLIGLSKPVYDPNVQAFASESNSILEAGASSGNPGVILGGELADRHSTQWLSHSSLWLAKSLCADLGSRLGSNNWYKEPAGS